MIPYGHPCVGALFTINACANIDEIDLILKWVDGLVDSIVDAMGAPKRTS